MENYTALDRNALLLATVVLDRKPEVSTLTQKEIASMLDELRQEKNFSLEYENLHYEDRRLHVSSDSKVILTYRNQDNREYYLYSDNISLIGNRENTVGHIYYDGIYCEYKNQYAIYSHNAKDTLICLGEGKGEENHSIQITAGEENNYEYGNLLLFTIDLSKQKELNEKLRENTLENLLVRGNTVGGKIEISEEGILFMSIPYGKGWRATVNGEEVPIFRADYGFSGIVLEPGSNIVEFQYHTPGIFLGSTISVLSLFLFIFVFAKNKVCKR